MPSRLCWRAGLFWHLETHCAILGCSLWPPRTKSEKSIKESIHCWEVLMRKKDIFPVSLQHLIFTKLMIRKLNRIYCRGLYLTLPVDIASNRSILGSNDLLKCLHFVNIWRRFLWLNKNQPMWTDSLCWKSEQNSVLKILACPSLPVSSTLHATQSRKLMQILKMKMKK